MRLYVSSIAIISCTLIFGVFSSASAATFDFGDATTFNGSTFQPFGARIDDSHIILLYSDSGSGTAVIGTVDGTDITFGSEYEFGGDSVSNFGVAMLDSTHAFISYAASGTGYGMIATISGASITFGSPVSFDTDVNNGGLESLSVTALDSTHVAMAYITERADYESNVIMATVSGTSITFGTSQELSDDSGQYVAIAAMDSTHFMLLRQEDDGTGYILAASVSGTSMTFGSPVAVSGYGSDPTIAPLSASRAVITYRSPDDDRTYAHVATLSGLAISIGSAYAVTDARTYYPTVAVLDATNLVLLYVAPDSMMEWYAVRLRVASDAVSGSTAELVLAEWGSQNRHVMKLQSGAAVFIMDSTAIVATTDTEPTAAPSAFTATVTGNSVALSWTNPADADFSSVSLRRATGGYPTRSTDGTHVASGSVITSHSDTGLADGTYYYALFALDESGNESDAAEATVVVSTAGSSSSSSSSQTAVQRQGNGGGRGAGTASRAALHAAQSRSSLSTSSSASSARSVTESMPPEMQTRTCARVSKWFGNSLTMKNRVNERLQKRFGFTCGQ